MKSNFDAIVFDMDGTLVDTEVVWHEAEEQLVRARGHIYTLEARSLLVGMRVDEGLAGLKAHYGFTDEVPALVEELYVHMRALIELQGVRVVAGIPELLEWVVANDVPRAIASAAPDWLIEAVVERLGWGALFPIRCSCDTEAAGKPAPDVYLTAARRLGVPPERCLAIEDTLNGARAAVAAGMTCYVVPDHKYSNPARLREVTPHVFASMYNVLEQLR